MIPALDFVGHGFEKKTLFLPQLLMSADAAKAAFEVIREAVGVGETQGETVIIATVHGDIHDIGKNIVKVLLETMVIVCLTWARMCLWKQLWRQPRKLTPRLSVYLH